MEREKFSISKIKTATQIRRSHFDDDHGDNQRDDHGNDHDDDDEVVGQLILLASVLSNAPAARDRMVRGAAG